MMHTIAIGVDCYADAAIPDLTCARRDAVTIAATLERNLEPAECSVQLLTNEAATARNVRLAIDRVHAELNRDDIVFVYFAGHGSPERASKRDNAGRYLLAYDTEYAHIHPTSLGMETDVPDWLSRLHDAKLVLLVLDCCFSGRAGGRSVMGPLLRAAGISSLADERLVSLSELELGAGRIILCASDDNQFAQEDTELGHGIFTHCFLDAITRDRAGERTVPLTTLYEEIARAVRTATKGAQQPVATFIPTMGAAFPVLPRTRG